jgi:ribosome biogenesis protein MAK21
MHRNIPTARGGGGPKPAIGQNAGIVNKFALGTYDPLARNPLFCGAENTLQWELTRLGNHFHPSVALFAQNLLDGVPIKYSGTYHIQLRFLDNLFHKVFITNFR